MSAHLDVEKLDGAVGRLLGGQHRPEPAEELLLSLVAVHLAVLEVLLLDGQVVFTLLPDQEILRVNVRCHAVSVPNLWKYWNSLHSIRSWSFKAVPLTVGCGLCRG